MTAGGIGGRGGETAWALLLALVILVFAPISFAFNGLLAGARPSQKNDFTSYYVAGLAVRHGMPEALYYPEPVGSLLAQASQQKPWIDLARDAGIENPNYYLYPPLFAVMFAPLTLLPYKVAYVAWTGFSALCLAASVAMLLAAARRDARGSWRSVGMLPVSALVLTVCLFYPVARNLAVGQSSLLLLALMTGALVALGRKSRSGDVWGALCLAGGIMLKLTPAVFLLWLALRRRWRALACSGAALVGLLAVSLAFVGTEPHQVYLQGMIGKLAGGTAFYPNQSLAGAMARLTGGDMRLADLVDPSSGPVAAQRLLGLALLAGSLLVIWRRRLDDDHAFGLLLLATLAVSPISWEHHYVQALIPAWILIRDAGQAGGWTTGRAAAAGAALALVGSYIGLRVIGAAGGLMLAQVAASACLIGGLMLWTLLASHRREPAGTPRAPSLTAPGALLVLMGVFAGGNFLFKVAEYERAYQYGDFTSYYVAAATLLDGNGPLYYPATPDMILARAQTPSPWTATAEKWGVPDANYYLYPPFFAMAMVPIVLIPYGAAHALWYVVNLAALCGAIWLFARAAPGARSGAGPHELTLAVIAVALSWPSLFTFGAGQANFVVLLFLLGALAALRTGREIPAGALAAGAAAIKLTPALLLVYLAWIGRWRALAAAAVLLAALVGAGALSAGWQSYAVYVDEMVPQLSRGCAHWVNQSLSAFFTRIVDGADMRSWALANPSGASRVLTTLASIALVGGAFAVVGRKRAPLDLEFSLMVVTTLFVSPLSWTHHSVLALMAFLLVARRLASRSEMTMAMAAALAVSFMLAHVYVKPPGLVDRGALRLLASYNMLGNLILWGIIARMIRRERGAPA